MMERVETHKHNPPHHPHHTVEVTIDGEERHIPAGKYLVSELKTELGVPVEYELEIVDDGELKPLAETDTIKVKGGEAFISHVKTGSSS